MPEMLFGKQMSLSVALFHALPVLTPEMSYVVQL